MKRGALSLIRSRTGCVCSVFRWDEEGEEEEDEGGQILMSWDSTILASVFFTLRMVRREAGL